MADVLIAEKVRNMGFGARNVEINESRTDYVSDLSKNGSGVTGFLLIFQHFWMRCIPEEDFWSFNKILMKYFS